MKPNKIPYSANRKVVWEDGYNQAIEEFEKFFDIKDKEDEDYFEVGVNEIREFIEELKSKEK